MRDSRACGVMTGSVAEPRAVTSTTASPAGSVVTEPSGSSPAVASDPAAEDVLSYEWRVNGLLQPNGEDPAQFVFTPPDNGSFVIGLTVRDDDGGIATASKTLSVQNVAPTATIASDPATTAADGSVVGLAAVVTDPGTADTTPNTFTYSWTATRNGVTIAISTDGRAPALAGLLREALDAWLPGDLDEWMSAADEARRSWRQDGVPMERRRPLLLETLNRLYEAK